MFWNFSLFYDEYFESFLPPKSWVIDFVAMMILKLGIFFKEVQTRMEDALILRD